MIAALSGLIGGAIGSFAMKTFATPAPAAAASTESEAGLSPGADNGTAKWDSEFAKLRLANQELGMRLASLESNRSAVPREAVAEGGDTESLADLQSTVAELAAALKNPQSSEASGLRQMVATALEEVQTAEQDERQLEREQREVDRIVERMGEYSEKLGLDAVQKQSMQDHLIDSSKKRNELFTTMRNGDVPREDIREAFTTQREDSDAALGRILSPAQLETYNAMNEERGGLFNGGGRGGRGRGN